MATHASLSLSTPTRVLPKSIHAPKARPIFNLNNPWKKSGNQSWRRRKLVERVRAGPDSISEKVEESIKTAQEACKGDPAGEECVAAWDTVEELSAAASHARDKAKDYDPLENYCKDNPETDECRTYED